MRAQRLSAAVVPGLWGVLTVAACGEVAPETNGAPPEPVSVVVEAASPGDHSAAWKARYDLDDQLEAILPRWAVYTIQPPPNGKRIALGCREYSDKDGWVYFRRAETWDKHCQLVAVPRGALGDPSRWVRFSMVELAAKGPHDYFMGLLDGGLPFADLLGITLALAEAEDEVPALPEALGSAQGRLRRRSGLRVPAHSSREPATPPWRPSPPLPGFASPADEDAVKERWEAPLARFFNELRRRPAGDEPVATLRHSPVGESICQAYAADRVPRAALVFPEVAAVAAVCEVRGSGGALEDVSSYVQRLSGQRRWCEEVPPPQERLAEPARSP